MPECDLCGEDSDECGCEERFVQHLSFEGGPLDGCRLDVPGNQFIVDVFIGTPAKIDGDSEGHMSGETIHQYTVCNTTRMQGSLDVDHYMGHVASRKVSLKVVNRVFTASAANAERNAEWLAEIENMSSDATEQNDDDDDDEGDEWKKA